MDRPASQAAGQQPGGAGDPLGAGPISSAPSGGRRGHQTADFAAAPSGNRRGGKAMTNTVELAGITKRYGAIEAVREVSFALPAGEAVALVGHNGAGKTTLLKLMLGLIHPTAGTIRVLGENPAAGEFAARRGLGYLPESVSFNAALTGREILTFYARLKREPVEKSLALLDKVGLGAAAERRVGTYSKGMRQRLGLAQALIGAPK